MDAASDFPAEETRCRNDAEGLMADVMRMFAYASRAGLVTDRSILAPIEEAKQSLLGRGTPDVSVLAPIMSTLVVLIAPMTLADLRQDRDPFEPRNQKRSRFMQMVMTVASLIMLAVIAISMQYLRTEKETLARLTELDEIKPAQRLTELRRIAQIDLPAARDDPAHLLDEKYYAKRAEYLQLKRRLVADTYDIEGVLVFPVVPLVPHLPAFGAHAAEAQANDGGQGAALSGSSGSGSAGGAALVPAVAGEPYSAERYMCSEQDGQVALPPESAAYPPWLKRVVLDAMTDFCFQVAVSGPNMELQSDPPDPLSVSRKIRDNMTWRTLWILPLALGFLGATIFMMQNVANMRTPAVEWHGLAMRIAMGGIAGVAVGWIAGGDVVRLPEGSPITVALGLSFLSGYSIDIFFQALARLSSIATQSLAKPIIKDAG